MAADKGNPSLAIKYQLPNAPRINEKEADRKPAIKDDTDIDIKKVTKGNNPANHGSRPNLTKKATRVAKIAIIYLLNKKLFTVGNFT